MNQVLTMNEMRVKGLWSQLKKRKVVRVALLYIAIAGLVALAGVVAVNELGGPQWALSTLITLFLAGFPIALILTWIYEITPLGIRRNSAGHIESLTGLDDDVNALASVAVLPFEDLSENGDQGYYCEGLAEEILDTLRRTPNLRVASRMAAFQLDSKETNARDVGRKLNVQAELKGGLFKSGDKLNISVELVNTTDGTLFWSQQYDQQPEGIFDIQDNIVNSITKSLNVPVKHGAGSRQIRINPKAYDLFLHGLSCFARHTTQENVYARQLFKQTIDLEPDFGRAWAALSYTYGYSYMYFNATDVNLAEAKRTSAQALRLAPHLAESHVSSGIACCMDQNYRKAEIEFEKAIKLDPRNFNAWYFFGRAKVHEGDLERALKLFERASKVRPEDFQSVLLQSQLYNSLDRQDLALEVTREGIERVRAVLELNPDDNRALNMGAFALLRLGHVEEATKWMSNSMRNAPMDSIIQYNGACFFSLSGDVERALDCLEHCLIKVGNINREWLTHDSDMDNIRGHPRFESVISSFPE